MARWWSGTSEHVRLQGALGGMGGGASGGRFLAACPALLRQFSRLLSSMRRESGEPVCGHVHVTGGEPFLHPQIRQILWLLLLHRRRFRYAIMSNGTILKHLPLVRLLNLKALQVSIDGDEKNRNCSARWFCTNSPAERYRGA